MKLKNKYIKDRSVKMVTNIRHVQECQNLRRATTIFWKDVAQPAMGTEGTVLPITKRTIHEKMLNIKGLPHNIRINCGSEHRKYSCVKRVCPIESIANAASSFLADALFAVGRCQVRFPIGNPSRCSYGPVIDSASNMNEYQESSWVVKDGRRTRLTTSAPS
jgi:hypothetical protein